MTSRRVLIVDDEPYILQILAFKLRRAGYTALEAASAAEAEALLGDKDVDCVVLDVGLGAPPDGFELAERLKMEERTRGIPIVFLTARALPRDVERARRLPAAEYITKPFALEDVLAAVRRQLDAGNGDA